MEFEKIFKRGHGRRNTGGQNKISATVTLNPALSIIILHACELNPVPGARGRTPKSLGLWLVLVE